MLRCGRYAVGLGRVLRPSRSVVVLLGLCCRRNGGCDLVWCCTTGWLAISGSHQSVLTGASTRCWEYNRQRRWRQQARRAKAWPSAGDPADDRDAEQQRSVVGAGEISDQLVVQMVSRRPTVISPQAPPITTVRIRARAARARTIRIAVFMVSAPSERRGLRWPGPPAVPIPVALAPAHRRDRVCSRPLR